MRPAKTRAAILLCSVALIGLTGSAAAGTARHHHHRHAVASAAPAPSSAGYADHRYAFMRNDWARRHAHAVSGRRHRTATPAPRSAVGRYSSNELVAEARKYLGTNPTGRRSLWCGAFMDMILRETGHKGGGNLALGYVHYGHRVSGPEVGAIAVMKRRGGGHVGVVVGVDANGNPIIVSGNHNHTVAQSVYPRRRIVAYVEPNN